MSELGKGLIITGGILIGVGLLIVLSGKIPGLGRLPGDILIRKENFSFYPPTPKILTVQLGMNTVNNFSYGEMFAESLVVGRILPKLEERRRISILDRGYEAAGLHFPVTTCLLVSVILTFVFSLIGKK